MTEQVPTERKNDHSQPATEPGLGTLLSGGRLRTSDESPRYTHDCEDCTFLGFHKHFDLYFCEQGGAGPTVIARYGDHGSEYSSGLAHTKIMSELDAARVAAVRRGYL